MVILLGWTSSLKIKFNALQLYMQILMLFALRLRQQKRLNIIVNSGTSNARDKKIM
jgi:hypothetical protein